MARKTVNIIDIVNQVNRFNAISTCSAEVRKGGNSLLESILMSADAYVGFGFYNADDLKQEAIGKPPGIIFDKSGRGDHQFPDETRRYYLCKTK